MHMAVPVALDRIHFQFLQAPFPFPREKHKLRGTTKYEGEISEKLRESPISSSFITVVPPCDFRRGLAPLRTPATQC